MGKCYELRFIFSQTAAADIIKPYLTEMTLSELHCVMTAGFAGIPGVIFALLIQGGVSARIDTVAEINLLNY